MQLKNIKGGNMEKIDFRWIIESKIKKMDLLKKQLQNLNFFYPKESSEYRQKRKEIIKEIFKLQKEIKKWQKYFKI